MKCHKILIDLQPLTLSRRVLPAADVASPSLAGHIFETILHPYTQHTLLDSLENLLLDGI